LILSVHVGVWHVLAQTRLLQSIPFTQGWPAPQAAQTAPPQSIPVSASFVMPSPQVALAHSPAEQCLLLQSLAITHFLASAHAGQRPPPQSTSVSVPFL